MHMEQSRHMEAGQERPIRKMLAQQHRWRGAWSPDLRSAKWEDAHRSQGRREEEEEESHKGQAQSADNVSFSFSLGSEQPSTKF